MNAFLTAFAETYLRPFSSLRRSVTYLGVFLGTFGYNIILIAVPLSYSGEDYTALLKFYGTFFGVMGLVYFPVFYALYATRDGRLWRGALMAVMLLAFIPLFYLRDNLYETAALCGLACASFWGQYHIAMSDNTTAKKRGYQVVLGDTLTIISSALSALLAVRYAGADYRTLILIVACLAMVAGSICQSIVSPFFPRLRLRDYLHQTRGLLSAHQGLMLRILQRSFLATPDIILPALLYFLNYNLTTIGWFIVVRTLIQTFLSPFIATLIQSRGMNEYLVGLVLCAFAWALFYALPGMESVLMVFIVLNATGLRVLNNSINVRLYAIGHCGSLMMNEFFLGLSRVMMLAVLIPMLFGSSTFYIAFMAIFALTVLALEIVLKGWAQARPKDSVSSG